LTQKLNTAFGKIEGPSLVFALFFSAIQLAALFFLKSEPHFLLWILTISSIVARLSSLSFQKIEKNICKFLIQTQLEFSFFVFIAFQFLMIEPLDDSSLNWLYIYGSLIILIFNLSGIICDKFLPNRSLPNGVTFGSLILVSLLFFMFTIFITYISYKLGIGIMGKASPSYPFKIESVLNHLKVYIFPFIYLFILDKSLTSEKKQNIYLAFSLLVIWVAVESVARGSRGLFILIPMMVLLLFVYRGIFNKKYIYKVLLPLVILLPFLISITHGIRGHRVSNKGITFKSLLDHTIFMLDHTNYHSLFSKNHYLRLFGTGNELIKFDSYVENKWKGLGWKELSKQKGGSLGFHTYVVDKNSPEAVHSSGVTGIADGFLLWGWPGVFLTTLLYSLFSKLIDSAFVKFFYMTSLFQALACFHLNLSFFGGEGTWSRFLRSPLYILILPGLFGALYVLERYVLVGPKR